jgi:hypothetical protein
MHRRSKKKLRRRPRKYTNQNTPRDSMINNELVDVANTISKAVDELTVEGCSCRTERCCYLLGLAYARLMKVINELPEEVK